MTLSVEELATKAMSLSAEARVGRRSFLKLLAFLMAAPLFPFSCGNLPGPADKGIINSLLLHLLGIETCRINLLDKIREFTDESFDRACTELYDFLSRRYQTFSGMDFTAFLDDLNSGKLQVEEDVIYLVEILRTNAIIVFYASPLGFALADYKRLPFQRTFIHSLIRDVTYPECYTPCHASHTCYAACHPTKGADQDLKASREMSGDGHR